MQLVAKIKLLPEAEQKVLVDATMKEYVNTINRVLNDMINYDQLYRFSSKMIAANIPSCLKNEAAGEAKSMSDRMFKTHCKQPVAKKRRAVWNNQNFVIEPHAITFPVFRNGKSRRIRVAAEITPEDYRKLQESKLGTMRIKRARGKYIARISYEVATPEVINTNIMGVDLGIKCPAVAMVSNGKARFFGNGKQNKHIRRTFANKRNKLQKQGAKKALRKLGDKEQRVMRDIDHKISRELIDFAISQGVGKIRLEELTNLREQTRKSRENSKDKYVKIEYEDSNDSWSFYRLQQFIIYKAKLAGIEVELVDRKYTSQRCPNCGKLNHAEDRRYECECGYHGHRDLVAAGNIMRSEGKRSPARRAIRSAASCAGDTAQCREADTL